MTALTTTSRKLHLRPQGIDPSVLESFDFLIKFCTVDEGVDDAMEHNGLPITAVSPATSSVECASASSGLEMKDRGATKKYATSAEIAIALAARARMVAALLWTSIICP